MSCPVIAYLCRLRCAAPRRTTCTASSLLACLRVTILIQKRNTRPQPHQAARMSGIPPGRDGLPLLTGESHHCKLTAMNPLNLRATAFVVLLLAFLFLSGVPFADAALSSVGTTDSCCFPPGNGEESPQSPCTTPDCPCLFCLNLHLPRFAEIFFLPLSSAGLISHTLVSPLAAFVRPIDYPPEHS